MKNTENQYEVICKIIDENKEVEEVNEDTDYPCWLFTNEEYSQQYIIGNEDELKKDILEYFNEYHKEGYEMFLIYQEHEESYLPLYSNEN